ncbi:hypothetical protein ABVY06_004629 [Escherichia coli]
MSQGCASGDVRLLTPAELDALRDEMQRDGEWAREELARRRACDETPTNPASRRSSRSRSRGALMIQPRRTTSADGTC